MLSDSMRMMLAVMMWLSFVACRKGPPWQVVRAVGNEWSMDRQSGSDHHTRHGIIVQATSLHIPSLTLPCGMLRRMEPQGHAHHD
jgi:hypothetical protein